MSPSEFVILAVLGLASGALGGLMGIGGSIVMIPVLTIALGPDQQLYQAAAMIVNVFVAIPATLRHARSNAIPWAVVFRMLPAGIVCILIGVAVSNDLDATTLRRIFGLFLVYVIYINVRRLHARSPEPNHGEAHATWARSSAVGGIMAFMAGLLGIGGGIITVPLLQRVCNLPLRQCIAGSSAAMCLTAIIGAVRKNATLDLHGVELADSLAIAGCMAPTAVIGGFLGATIVHVIPINAIRIAFIALMAWGCYRMLIG